MILESGGISIGLLLAVPLFRLVSVALGIALCASFMAAVGIAGLARFGLSDPRDESTRKEQGETPVKGVRTSDNISVP